MSELRLAAGRAAAARSVVGTDRYNTAARVATLFGRSVTGTPTSGPAVTMAGIATGLNWLDAVVGTAAMGIDGGPLLLTQSDQLAPTTAAALDRSSTYTSSVTYQTQDAIAAHLTGD